MIDITDIIVTEASTCLGKTFHTIPIWYTLGYVDVWWGDLTIYFAHNICDPSVYVFVIH